MKPVDASSADKIFNSGTEERLLTHQVFTVTLIYCIGQIGGNENVRLRYRMLRQSQSLYIYISSVTEKKKREKEADTYETYRDVQVFIL